MPAPGKDWTLANAGAGGMILWPMFGATNQLLAGLAFLVIAFWMWRRRIPIWFITLPMLFMLVLPAWVMVLNLTAWINAPNPNSVLIFVAIVTLFLEAWMLVEAFFLWPHAKGVLEEALPPLRPTLATEPQGDGGRSC